MIWTVCPPGSAVDTTIECYRLNVFSSAQATWMNRTPGNNWNQPGANGVPADRQGTPAVSLPVPNPAAGGTNVQGDATQLVVDWFQGGVPNNGILCVNPAATTVPMCPPGSNGPPRIRVVFGPPIP
jgi:hypothetical protein